MQEDAPPQVILQVLPAMGTGGVERGTIEMVQAIARAGWIPLVASSGGRFVPDLLDAGGDHITLPLDQKEPLHILRNAFRLAQVIRERNVSLVHARSRAPAWSALLAARMCHIPFVTTYHGAYGDGRYWGKRLYNSIMARGDRVIAISAFIQKMIERRHKTDRARIRLIHRGVDISRFDPALVDPENCEDLAETWQIRRGAPVVMLPGRVTGWKGQSLLIEALKLMRHKEAIGVMVGGGAENVINTLLAQATSSGIASRIWITGDCDDMPAALTLADVVVSASTRPEAFGRVVVEAQAMGKIIIASNHGGAIETVQHGKTGFLVQPRDPMALARALDHVLDMKQDERAAMQTAGRAAVAENFTTRAMQDATLAVYRELLQKTAKAPSAKAASAQRKSGKAKSAAPKSWR